MRFEFLQFLLMLQNFCCWCSLGKGMDYFYEVTWRTERARLNKQRFGWRHSFSEIFTLIITVIGLG